MEKMVNVNSPLSVEEQAKELHKNIVYNYRMASHHLVDAARYLKEMRDTKAYLSLGMETFDKYTEEMAGIKARQAYTYISTLERLGQTMMEENAGLGITKLSLLAEITPVEREEFVEENDLAGMTVKEIEALVAENNRRGEQINLFEEKEAEMAEKMDRQHDTIKELLREIEEMKSQPSEPVNVTATVEPDPAIIKRIEKELKAKLEATFNKKLEKETAAVRADLSTAKEAAAQAEKEKAEIEERVRREMAAQHNDEMRRVRESTVVSADGDYRAVDIYFAQLQETANNLLHQIEQIRQADGDKAARTGTALAAYFEQLAVKCKEVAQDGVD